MSPYRGLVLGWYHNRNAGDDRLQEVILSWLQDHHLYFLPHSELPPPSLVDSVDYILLGGGSIANAPHGVFTDLKSWCRRHDKPVYTAGLGISSFDNFPSTFEAIPESGGFAWVRDEQSKINIGNPDWCKVAPDIAWLLPFPCQRTPGAACVPYLNLRPWPKLVWDPKAVRKKLETVLPGLRPLPFCFHRNHPDAPEITKVLPDAEMPEAFDPTAFSFASFILTMRFHAVIFAVQTGIPFLAIHNSKKLSYLMDSIGLEDFILKLDDLDNFESKVEKAQTELCLDRLYQISEDQRHRVAQVAHEFKAHIEETCSRKRSKRYTSLGKRIRNRIRGYI